MEGVSHSNIFVLLNRQVFVDIISSIYSTVIARLNFNRIYLHKAKDLDLEAGDGDTDGFGDCTRASMCAL